MNGIPDRNGTGRSRASLLSWINMVSFAVDDIKLFLDTHPQDPAALEYFNTYSELRRQALEDFAQAYYPLTIDTVPACARSWEKRHIAHVGSEQATGAPRSIWSTKMSV